MNNNEFDNNANHNNPAGESDSTYHMSFRNTEETQNASSQSNTINSSNENMQNAYTQNTNVQNHASESNGNTSYSAPYRPASYDYQNTSGTSQTTGTQQTAGNGSQYNQIAGNYVNPYASTSQYGYQAEKPADNTGKAKKKRNGGKVVKLVGGAVAFGAIAGCVMIGMNLAFGRYVSNSANTSKTVATTTSSNAKTTTVSSKTASSVSSVVSNVMPSIVSITSTFQTASSSNSQYNDFYNWFYGQGSDNSQSEEQKGSGSGIIISETSDQLMVVTNNHVIADSKYGTAKKVQVTFADNKTVEATIKGTDADADLAVLVINKSDMKETTLNKIKVAVIGDSDSMKVGDDVIAIGNALGYGQSVTTGVVSALNREVQMTDKTMTLLQTDAAINPGNSGGALLNSAGEVIGINSVKYSSDEVEGMGYAIPMAIAKPIIEELMNEEKVSSGEQAYLGIRGSEVSEELSSAYNMPKGVWVSNVSKNSPASDAGIQQRDIITKFNNREITSMTGLQEQIAKKKAGTEVTITVKRQNASGEYKEKTLKVKLGKKSDAPASFNQNSSDSQEQQGSDGQTDDNQSNGGSIFGN